MGKDKKERNPADAFRKEQRKKEIEKSKKERTVVKEVRDLLNDPRKIDAEIEKAKKQSDDFKLDKSLKDRVKELQMMKGVALKKQLIMEASGKRPASHDSTDDKSDKTTTPNAPIVRRAEDSIYYHPVYNQSGAPPPGQQAIYKPLAATTSTNIPSQPVMGGGSIPLPPPLRPMTQPTHMRVAGGMMPPPPPPPRTIQQLPSYLIPQFAQQQQSAQYMMAPPPPPPRLPLPGGVGAPPLPRPPVSQVLSQQQLALQQQFQLQQQISYQQQQFMQQYQQQSMEQHEKQQLHQQRQQTAPKRAAQFQTSVVDPLDPSGNNYTARFGGRDAPSARGEETPSSDNGIHVNPPSSSASTMQQQPHFAMVDSHSEELMRSRFVVQEEEEKGKTSVVESFPPSSSTVSIKEAPPLSAAEELMRRRFQIPSDEEEDSQFVSGAMLPPSVADIMRRRFLVADNSSAGAAATVLSEHCNEEEEMEGPSRPSFEVDYEAYGYGSAYDAQQPGADEEEDDDCEDVYIEEGVGATGANQNPESDDVEEEESEDYGPLSLLERFKVPVLTLSMASKPSSASVTTHSSSSAAGLMSLLGGYGDDDDDEEEEEDKEMKVEETSITTAPSVAVPFLSPAELLVIANHTLAARSSVCPVVDAPFAWPVMSSKLSERPQTLQSLLPLPTSTTINNSGGSGHRPSDLTMPATVSSLSRPANGLISTASGLLKGPRIVKTDSAVTALVPNVLKVKRQMQRQHQSFSAKMIKTVHVQPVVSTAVGNATTSTSGSTSAGGSLEDAYNSFLSEIGELGGLEE